jgi:hypothetical protein
VKRQLAWMFCAEDSPANPSPAPGEGGGLADERWLWPEYARIVEALEPAIVVGENVPPLRRAGLPHVLADLARLGFDAEWASFRASDLGAPHERNRIWIVATHAERLRLRLQRRPTSVEGWLARAVGEAAGVVAATGEAWPPAPHADASGLARPDGERLCSEGRSTFSPERPGDHAPTVGVAPNADGQGQPQQGGLFGAFRGWACDAGWRDAPPAVRGVDDGGADRLDLRCDAPGGCQGEACDHEQAPDAWRIAGLGNAVVECCAFLVGRATVDALLGRSTPAGGEHNGAPGPALDRSKAEQSFARHPDSIDEVHQ